jgi:uncharacterized protein YcaQ
MSRTLSAGQARRIALAAQGLAAPRPARPVTRATFRALTRRLGALQLDSVNVMVRTHYMPAFARLGAYPPALLEEEAWGRRPSLFEYWGHVACLMPVEMQPLFRWRMRASRRKDDETAAHARLERARPGYIDGVLDEIRRRGPVTGGDFAEGPRKSGWWNWSDGKVALERLFWTGQVAIKTRRGFERVYDLTERVLPADVLNAPTPAEADAKRELVRIAARALGVASLADLADYYRLLQADARAAAADLVAAGELERVRVDGWDAPAFLAVGARVPRRATGAALLSPFDNMIWRRERTQRMFGLRYRIGLYTPADQREHGYYVYPFLMDEGIAARVDLKSDRQAGRLLVQAAHLEPGTPEDETAARLAAELVAVAAWQGLGAVAVMKKGGLAAALSRAIG